MKNHLSYLLACVLCSGYISAQTIKVQPYLQDATPNSIYILWETDALQENDQHLPKTEPQTSSQKGSARSGEHLRTPFV